MVDSIQGTQLIVMIHFSFTAGFTWCTIAAPARFTNTFFSHRASTQFIACMTCLTSQTFLFWFLQTIAFLPVYLCLSFNTSEYVSLPCFIQLLSFPPSVLPYSHQSDPGLCLSHLDTTIAFHVTSPMPISTFSSLSQNTFS